MNRPRVSVVIPAYNEAILLPRCLQALKEQDYQGSFEIIVVDNNSTDVTSDIARLYGAKVIKERRRGVAFARQAGFMAASGEIICSTDADTIVPPHWLTAMVKAFDRDPNLVAVGGRFELVDIDSSFKLFVNFFLPIVFAFDRLNHHGHFTGCNFAVRKDAFLRVGGFDTSLKIGEDIDLCIRVRQLRKVKILHEIKVQTSARRYDLGLVKSFEYVIMNYFSIVWSHTLSSRVSMENISKKPLLLPFESYKSQMTLWSILVSFTMLLVIIFGIGFIPWINLGFGSVSHMKTSEKLIALTFDDGPNDPYTSQVLDILKAKEVRAAFFLVGQNVRRNPDAVKKIIGEGHVVANHSYSHNRRVMAGPPEGLLRDVEKADNEIYKVIGKRPRYYRPPYGYRTVWGDAILKKHGYKIVTWDDLTTDYKKLASKIIVSRIVKRAHPGSIIVLHDGAENHQRVDRSNSVHALPEIIDRLQAEGYHFVTIDELIGSSAYF